MTAQLPSVGRVVHYADQAGECTAATITGVRMETIAPTQEIDLVAFSDVAVTFHQHVFPDHTDRTPGTWHWPERS